MVKFHHDSVNSTNLNLIFPIQICATCICATKSDIVLQCDARSFVTALSLFLILPVQNFSGFCSNHTINKPIIAYFMSSVFTSI